MGRSPSATGWVSNSRSTFPVARGGTRGFRAMRDRRRRRQDACPTAKAGLRRDRGPVVCGSFTPPGEAASVGVAVRFGKMRCATAIRIEAVERGQSTLVMARRHASSACEAAVDDEPVHHRGGGRGAAEDLAPRAERLVVGVCTQRFAHRAGRRGGAATRRWPLPSRRRDWHAGELLCGGDGAGERLELGLGQQGAPTPRPLR